MASDALILVLTTTPLSCPNSIMRLRILLFCVFVVSIPFVARVWKSSVRSVSCSATLGIYGCSKRNNEVILVSVAGQSFGNQPCEKPSLFSTLHCDETSDNTHKARAFQSPCLDDCMFSLDFQRVCISITTNNPHRVLGSYEIHFSCFPKSRALSGGTGGRQE